MNFDRFLEAAEKIDRGDETYACHAIGERNKYNDVVDSFSEERAFFFDTFSPQIETDEDDFGRHAFFSYSSAGGVYATGNKKHDAFVRTLALCFAYAMKDD